MLQPKKNKHRKAHKGRIRGNAQRGATLAFGSFGLKAMEPKWITNRQIEAARQAMTRHMKREGNVWIRIFPDKPITRKPQLKCVWVKVKVTWKFWAAVVKPGLIMFELDGVTCTGSPRSTGTGRSETADQDQVRYPSGIMQDAVVKAK